MLGCVLVLWSVKINLLLRGWVKVGFCCMVVGGLFLDDDCQDVAIAQVVV